MEQITYRIIENLKQKENHLRQIAKDININHMSIKRTLDTLTKKNILDIRKQGRNHIYSIKNTIEAVNIQKQAEYEKLTILLKKHPELRLDIENLQKLNAKLILIFGSYAKNLETNLSDIDVYIETKSRIKASKRFSIKTGRFRLSPLANEIIKDHIIIKGVDRLYEILEKIGRRTQVQGSGTK